MTVIGEPFLWRALLGGLALAAAIGPLGCFVVWRRMAYFGDCLAHGALLGVALGIALEVGPQPGILAVSLAVAGLLVLLERQRHLAPDTLLGILAHATLAVGMIAVSLMERVRIDLNAYLFGDILALAWGDVWWIAGGAVAILAGLRAIWRPMLAIAVDRELAEVDGVRVGLIRALLMLLIALVVALAMKVVGILLTTALLIIPAAAARQLARTPEQMAVGAGLVAAAAVLLGLGLSLAADTPSGPSIVVAATLLFLLCLAILEIGRWVGVR